jgi:hypothetical protein
VTGIDTITSLVASWDGGSEQFEKSVDRAGRETPLPDQPIDSGVVPSLP